MRLKKALSAVLAGTMAASMAFTGMSFAPVTTAMADEAAGSEGLVVDGYKNPVYNAETDTTDWEYVYFGSYPQSEVKGEELTSEIKKADYDADGVAVVDGVKYKRLDYNGVTYGYKYGTVQYSSIENVPLTEGEFFEWKSKKEYHYFKYEPLKWRVLESKDGQLFLMADQAIDCQNYMPRNHKVTWYISELRSWLNEYNATYNEPKVDYSMGGFLSMAFTEEEENAITRTYVQTENNNYWELEVPGMPDSGDESTMSDLVYIPSAEEVTNVNYGFAPEENVTSKTRQMDMTDYAFAKGGWAGSEGQYQGNCWWLLRTPGDNTRKGAMVYRDGRVYLEGYQSCLAPYYCTVPVCHVDAKSEYVVKVTDADIKDDADKKDDVTQKPAVPTTPDAVEPSTGGSVSAEVMLGDVDNNESVDLADALLVLKMALKIVGEQNKDAADVDGNGQIELKDAQLILQKALKIISDFPNSGATDTPATTVPVTTAPAVSAVPSEKPVVSEPAEKSEEPVVSKEPLVQPEDKASGHVWIAGDSIAAQHGNGDAYIRDTIGWGVIIGKYFTDDVTIHNTALSSRSSKSYISEPQYQEIMTNIGAGDYLLISFGHNDEFPTAERYTDPYGSSNQEGSYKWYLKNYYIEPAMRKGAIPVLISSVVERNYVDGEFHYQFHSVYKTAMEELVAEYKEQGITIPYVDLQSRMLALYQEDGLGQSASKLLHSLYLYADSEGSMKETMDNTHFTLAGARYATKYILEGLKSLNLDIMKFANEDMIKTLDSIALLDTFKVDDLDTSITLPAESDDEVDIPEVTGGAVDAQ